MIYDDFDNEELSPEEIEEENKRQFYYKILDVSKELDILLELNRKSLSVWGKEDYKKAENDIYLFLTELSITTSATLISLYYIAECIEEEDYDNLKGLINSFSQNIIDAINNFLFKSPYMRANNLNKIEKWITTLKTY